MFFHILLTYQLISQKPIVCHVYEIESIPQTISPSGTKLIGLNCFFISKKVNVKLIKRYINNFKIILVFFAKPVLVTMKSSAYKYLR